MVETPITYVALDGQVAKGSAGMASVPPNEKFEVGPYDPTKEREGVRSWIAMSLIGLLAVIIISPFVLILLGVGCDALGPGSDVCRRIPDISLKEIMDMLLTPMVGLVGAVTGFYFGENKNRT